MNRVTREKDEKFTELIHAMISTLDSRDLVNIHKKLSNGCWEISEMSYKNVDFPSYKKQKNSQVDSQGESKAANNQNNNESKSNWNFPRMTRAQSKTFMTRMQSISKDSDVIPGNPMATDSHYNGSMRDNKSLNNEEAIRVQFSSSLIDAFITKQEEYD